MRRKDNYMKYLDPYIAKIYSIDEEMAYEIMEIDPVELLSFARLDIAAKLIYLDNSLEYNKKVYREQVRAITKGACVEAGNSKKKSLNDFCDCFDRLKQDIMKNGFDKEKYYVPVDRNMQILDGAHRVAIAIKLNIKIKIIKLDVVACDKYDFAFFEEQGLSDFVLDAMVLKYIATKSNIYIANVWPSAVGFQSEIIDIISSKGVLGIYKEVKLNENGAFNYLHQIYSHDDWVGNIDNGFEGVYRKLMPCFKLDGPTRVFVFESSSSENVLEIKREIRNLFSIGKHSIHITDTDNQAIDMANLLFNQNSIDFLNKANVIKYKTFNKKILGFWKDNENHKDSIMVTSSAVLNLYGIREANDIDYLVNSDIEIGGDCHNDYIDYYDVELEELFENPYCYFYYNRNKYVSLEMICKFKRNRNEGKDQDDIQLVNEILNSNKNVKLKVALLRKKRRMITRIQGVIIKIAHVTKTYDLLREIYHKLRK